MPKKPTACVRSTLRLRKPVHDALMKIVRANNSSKNAEINLACEEHVKGKK